MGHSSALRGNKAESLREQAVREMHEEIHAERLRLAGLEDTIMLSRPDFCEAAESILAPMMAVLEKRYDWRECPSYQQMGEVKDAYKRLYDALMKADEAEQA